MRRPLGKPEFSLSRSFINRRRSDVKQTYKIILLCPWNQTNISQSQKFLKRVQKSEGVFSVTFHHAKKNLKEYFFLKHLWYNHIITQNRLGEYTPKVSDKFPMKKILNVCVCVVSRSAAKSQTDGLIQDESSASCRQKSCV